MLSFLQPGKMNIPVMKRNKIITNVLPVRNDSEKYRNKYVNTLITYKF